MTSTNHPHQPNHSPFTKMKINLLFKNNRICKDVKNCKTSPPHLRVDVINMWSLVWKNFLKTSFCNIVWFVPKNKIYMIKIRKNKIFYMIRESFKCPILLKVIPKEFFRNPIISLWWGVFANVVNDF